MAVCCVPEPAFFLEHGGWPPHSKEALPSVPMSATLTATGRPVHCCAAAGYGAARALGPHGASLQVPPLGTPGITTKNTGGSPPKSLLKWPSIRPSQAFVLWLLRRPCHPCILASQVPLPAGASTCRAVLPCFRWSWLASFCLPSPFPIFLPHPPDRQ